MMLTDLADACRKAGLKVVEVDGWRTRGHGPMSAVQTVVCHHTATSRAAAGDYPSLGIVRDGRSDLPGPLAQLGLGRSGTVYVIAAGVSYHAGETFEQAQDNWHAIGIEAEADGISSWPAEQVDAYARLCAALIDHYDLPVTRVQGHKEIAAPRGRKVDPNFDMDLFRDRVTETTQEDDMSQYAEQLNRIENGVKALRKKTAERHQTTVRAIRKGFDDLEAAVADDATKRQVARVRAQLDELADELAVDVDES